MPPIQVCGSRLVPAASTMCFTSPGQALGARVLTDLLQACPIERLVTIDLHTAAIEGFFSIAVEHLSAVPLLAVAARPFVEGPSIVVAPNLGAVKLAKQYAQYLELPLAIVHKIRQSGETVSVQHVVGDVRDRALVRSSRATFPGGRLIGLRLGDVQQPELPGAPSRAAGHGRSTLVTRQRGRLRRARSFAFRMISRRPPPGLCRFCMASATRTAGTASSAMRKPRAFGGDCPNNAARGRR